MLRLIEPSIKEKEQILAYKKAFQENGDLMDGTSFLGQLPTIEEWLESLELMKDPATLPEGFALAATWLVVREEDQALVGMTNLRFELSNPYLRDFGGHIGYSVHPDERKKGYGKIILKKTLKKAEQLGIPRVLITCKETNVASAKIIEDNQGRLESKVIDTSDGSLVRRYWITNKN